MDIQVKYNNMQLLPVMILKHWHVIRNYPAGTYNNLITLKLCNTLLHGATFFLKSH